MANYNSIMDALYAKIDDYIERGILDKSAKSSTIQECLNKIVRLSLDDMSNPEAGGALIEKMNNSDMVISDQLALVLEAYANSIGSNKYEDSDVRFIGMNGDIIYGYSKDEFLALTQMPPNPKVEGFTSQGWNYDFDDAQAYVTKYGKLNVGQMYIPSDGKTHMIMELKERLTIPLTIQQTVSEGVTINWGDGSEEETIEGTGTVTTSHTYASEGTYEITLDAADGCTLDFGGTVDNTDYNVFGEVSYSVRTTYIKKLYIGDGVISIGNYAFNGCNQLKSLTIPNGVTSIETYAFYGCNQLISLTIPNSITSIETYAFNGCNRLISLTIPNGVTNIGNYVFYSCYQLASLTIPNGVTSIGDSAFNNCVQLASLIIPNGVTSIGDYMFYGCAQLTSLTIPNSITSIETYAFNGCNRLISLTIPNGVTSIGQLAFVGAQSIYTITILAETPPTLATGTYASFKHIPSDCTIYVPYGTGDTYKAASGWSTWASQIQELPNPEG